MANKNIKGITIEIGGDTTKLGKALENSEKKSRSLQVELREIQQSLKFNPTNVEILAQKQEVLTQNIAETSEKLDTLKEAERQVIAQFQRGEVAEEQVRALQREIIKTENQLDSMKSELTSTNTAIRELGDGTADAKKHTQEYEEALDNAGQELTDFKDNNADTFDAIKNGVIALGAGAVAVASYATMLSTEFDKAFNGLQAQTGATAEEMALLEESAENLYKNNLGESIQDVADSMAIVKQQTKLTGQELEDVTANALLMRDTFGFDVNESIRAVNSMMNQFGISADEAYNLIAQGAQNGLNQNGDLLDTVNEYAVQFKDAGYSAEDMFNMLNNGAMSGTWSIDKLGDAVKEYNIRMSDGTASEALTKLGLNADEVTRKFGEGGASAQEATSSIIEALKGVEDEQERYTLGQEIMGTMWEDLGEDAVYALLDTQGAISTTSDALENINDIKYDDLGSSLQGLKRTLETDVIQPLGEELKPVVEDVIDYVEDNGPAIKETLTKITSAIAGFVKLVVENGNTIVGIIASIGAGVLAWKITTIIAGLIPLITSMIAVVKGGAVAWQGLNLAMKANIIGLIIGAITALVTAFIYFWNTSEGFRNFWIGLWEIIKNAVSVAVEAIVSFFSGAWDRIVAVWSAVSGWFSNLATSISGFFSSAWDMIVSVWSTVTEFFSGVWESIVEIFSPAVEWFSALFTSIYNTLSSIITVIIGLVRGCWTMITTIFSVAFTWFNTTVIQPIKNLFSTLWSGVTNLATNAWNTIKTVFSVVATWFNDTIITPVSNFFSGLWDRLKSGASNAWSGIKSVFSNVTGWFKNQFTNAWTAVKNVFSTGGKIFTGIKDGIVESFKTVVNAIIGGINTVVAIPFDAINGMLNKIRNASFLGVSPFKKMWSQDPLAVPQIPLLWRGGILKKGQMGLLEGNGAEAVVPLERETEWSNNIARKMSEYLSDSNIGLNNVALASKMDEMIDTMKALKSTIVLDTGVLVGETINQIDEQLGNNYILRARGV